MPCPKCGEQKVQIPSGKWKCRPCERAWRRDHYARNRDREQAKQRDRMKRLRADPETAPMMREIGRRAYANGGDQKQYERIARMQVEQPFCWRAQLLTRKLHRRVTEAELRALWDSQGGLCALTGQPMDIRAAELDHIVPRSRGGTNEPSNLRWLTRAANQAKGDLLDEEFLALCVQVAEHIGRLIVVADQAGRAA